MAFLWGLVAFLLIVKVPGFSTELPSGDGWDQDELGELDSSGTGRKLQWLIQGFDGKSQLTQSGRGTSTVAYRRQRASQGHLRQ